MTYAEAVDAAQKEADLTGRDMGIEKDAFGYRFFMLPQKQNRYGYELRCEVVHCSILSKVLPGHGP